MIITIDVTQDDIDKGQPCKAGDCPVYHALTRRVASEYLTSVGPKSVSFMCGMTWRHVELPAPAKDFIERFDRGHEVEPFSFDLDVPDELLAAVTT